MQVSQQYQLEFTMKSVKRLFEKDLSIREASLLSSELLMVLLEDQNHMLDSLHHVQMIKFLLQQSKQLANFQTVQTLLKVLDETSYPQQHVSHFKQDKMLNLNKILQSSCIANQKEPILKEEYQNCLYLQEIVSHLVYQLHLFENLQIILSIKEQEVNKLPTILLVLLRVTKIINAELLNANLPTIINRLSQLIFRFAEDGQLDVLVSLINMLFRIKQQITTNNILDERFHYELTLVNGLINCQLIEKGLKYFNQYIEEKFEYILEKSVYQNELQNIMDSILKCSKICQFQNYMPIIRLILQVCQVNSHNIKMIIEKKGLNPLYQSLLANYRNLSSQNMIQILQNLKLRKASLEEKQVDFLYRLTESHLEQSIVKLLSSLINKENGTNNRYARKARCIFRVRNQSIDNNVNQLAAVLTKFLAIIRNCAEFQQKMVLEDIALIIVQICDKIERLTSQEYLKALKKLKEAKIEYFLEAVIRVLPKDLTKLEPISSIMNKLLSRQQYGYYETFKGIIQYIFSKICEEDLNVMLSLFSSFSFLRNYWFCILLYNYDLSIVTPSMVSSILNLSQFQSSQQYEKLKTIEYFSKLKNIKIALIFNLMSTSLIYDLEVIESIVFFIERQEIKIQSQFTQNLTNFFMKKLKYYSENNNKSQCMACLSLINSFIKCIGNNSLIKQILSNQISGEIASLFINFEDEVSLKLLKIIENQEVQMRILKENISYFSKVQNCLSPKYQYLANILLIHRKDRNVMEMFIQYTGHALQRFYSSYEYFKFSSNEQNKAIVKLMITLINIHIEENFVNEEVKTIFHQLENLSVESIIKASSISNALSENNPNILRNLIEKSKYMTNISTLRQLPSLSMDQLKFYMVFHCKFTQITENNDSMFTLMKCNKESFKIWIFLINYVRKDKLSSIQEYWSYFTSNLKAINTENKTFYECFRYILLYESNDEKLTYQRIQNLMEIFANNSQEQDKFIVKLIYQKISSFQSNLTSQLREWLFWRFDKVLDFFFLHSSINKSQQAQEDYSKLHANTNIDAFNSNIQILHELSRFGPIQMRIHVIKRIVAIIKRQHQKTCQLKNSQVPTGLINFYNNTFVNVVVQLFSSASTFIKSFLNINFTKDLSQICYAYQKLLVTLQYTSASSRSCFQVIKQLKCFSKKQQNCLVFLEQFFNRILSNMRNEVQRESIESLFRIRYIKSQRCRCPDPIGQSYTSFVLPFEISVTNKRSQFIEIRSSQSTDFCEMCFILKREVYCFRELPKYLIIRPQQQNEGQDLQISQSITLKGVNTNNIVFKKSYCLHFVVFSSQLRNSQLPCAKRSGDSWFLLKNQKVTKFQSFDELVNAQNKKKFRAICCMYVSQNDVAVESAFSQSSQQFYLEVLKQNEDNFVCYLNQNKQFERIMMKILEDNIENEQEKVSQEYLQQLFQLYEMLLQNYSMRIESNEMLIDHIPQFIQQFINKITSNSSLNFTVIATILTDKWSQNPQYYRIFISKTIIACFQQVSTQLNSIILFSNQEDKIHASQLCEQLSSFANQILKKIINLLSSSISETEAAFIIEIIHQLMNSPDCSYSHAKICQFFIYNQLILSLIQVFIHNYHLHQIDTHKYPALEKHAILSPLKGKMNSMITTIISKLISFITFQNSDGQNQEDHIYLTPSDEKQLINTKFIEILIATMEHSDIAIELLSTVLSNYQIIFRENQRTKVLFRIAILYLRMVEYCEQKPQRKRQQTIIQFIFRQFRQAEDLEMLFGYEALGQNFNNFKCFGENSNSSLIAILIRYHQHSSQFRSEFPDKQALLKIILNFFKHILTDQYKFDSLYLKLVPLLDRIVQSSFLNQENRSLLNQIYDMEETLMKRALSNKNIKEGDIKWIKNNFNLQGFQNKTFVKMQHLKGTRIEVAFFTLDAAFSQSDLINDSTIPPLLQKYVLIMQFICRSKQPFEHLVKLDNRNRSNCIGPTSIYLRSSNTSESLIQVKKQAVFVKDNDLLDINLEAITFTIE